MIIRLYYDKLTGDVFFVNNMHTVTTVDRDLEVFPILSERDRETFDYIELEFGQYAQDFMECNGYRVNTETKEIEFSYPDPNEPEPQEPVYRKPLSEHVNELETALLEMTIIMALQEQKLIENEQAILELSMLIGGIA